MWEKQSLPQKSHLCVVSGLLELLCSFLRALLPVSAFTSFFSPVLMLLRWKALSLFSYLYLAYVVHVSLPYISVLTTQALYTTILVFTVSLGLIHTREVRRASVVAAFLILSSICVQEEVVGDGGAKICELFNDIGLVVIYGDGWQFHCIRPQDVCLLQTDG